MSSLKNKVQLIGNVGDNPEITNTEDGKKRARFSVATNENYKDANGVKQQIVDWHNLVAWGKTAEIIEKYVFKGSEIAIEGKLKPRSYDNKEGVKVYVIDIVVNEVLLLGSKKSNESVNA